MLRNYLRIAVRGIWKHRLFSFINIFGLACGLLVCLLAIIYLKGVWSYDNFHPQKDRIYRILTDVTTKEGNKMAFASSPLPLAVTLKNDYNFVENSARVVRTYGEVFGNDKRMGFLSYVVDPSFFKMFGHTLVSGTFPDRPGTVIITETSASKIFGKMNPIGKTLQQEGSDLSVVTGIIKNTANSHLDFDILFCASEAKMRTLDGNLYWNGFSFGYTYVLLKEGAKSDQLAAILPDLSKSVSNQLDHEKTKDYLFRAQALTKISPTFENLMNGTHEPSIGGLITVVGVGLVAMLMAAFNYINLTIARSMSRAREVGIRKTSGALRGQLLGQFIAESIVLSLLALLLAFGMLEMVKPMDFVQRWIIKGVVWDWQLWASFVVFGVLIGLLAGIIPARFLSGFQPAEVLRSQTGLKVVRGISLRKVLIVAQFSISLIATMSLITIMRQQNYMVTGDYGFESANILNIPLNGISYEKLANELDKLAGVEGVSGIVQPFGHHGPSGKVRLTKDNSNPIRSFQYDVAPNFVQVLHLKLLAGSDFGDFKNRVLINEEAVKKFNLADNKSAIGKTLWLDDSTEVVVGGVLKDFRFSSFAWKIMPLVLRQQTSAVRYMHVSIAPNSKDHVLSETNGAWAKLRPYDSFEGQWYSDFLFQQHSHRGDINFMAILLGISFSIACLGLLGIVTYNTQIRIKEVGIRKVMGAEVSQILWLLTNDFVKLLTLAGVIALPLGYLTGYAFLSNFAYHVQIGWETLGFCFGTLFILGGVIIFTKTYPAAKGNCVDALASE